MGGGWGGGGNPYTQMTACQPPVFHLETACISKRASSTNQLNTGLEMNGIHYLPSRSGRSANKVFNLLFGGKKNKEIIKATRSSGGETFPSSLEG